ncbi:MAG: hypothetical protein AAFQ57_10055 [Cyanobacteria bacterium J06626_14]
MSEEIEFSDGRSPEPAPKGQSLFISEFRISNSELIHPLFPASYHLRFKTVDIGTLALSIF